MNEINVSIIIPCYNCEKYIEENLKSVLNQTFENFEVIYINDGSKDNTINILKQYEEKDTRIKVVDIENGGVSHARNLGLDNAKRRIYYFYRC